jgi:NAD(P)-dependent dehydrogenase (short-subunit alcohol dehydrogenase family)
VTGAGRGLGRALTHALVSDGVKVAGISRPGPALDALAQDLGPSRFVPIAADIAEPDQVADAFARIRAQGDRVTILINNAAVYPRRDFLEETPASFMHTMNVNFGGSLFCCQQALTDMVDLGFGRIVNVISYAHRAPTQLAAAYSVSKGAQQVLGRAILADLGDRFPDILINDWAPGVLATEMGLPDGISPETAAAWGARLAVLHDRALQGTTFERDTEVLPALSTKRRVLNKVLGRKRTPRRLG